MVQFPGGVHARSQRVLSLEQEPCCFVTEDYCPDNFLTRFFTNIKRNTTPQTDGAVTPMSSNDGVHVGELMMAMELISQQTESGDSLVILNRMSKVFQPNCQLGKFSTKGKGEL